ncbi:hypothetical protein GQR58_028608 [Nymphon striatum]|nr:hypothetical protein GQR58_028608 [Nymphon striatum]
MTSDLPSAEPIAEAIIQDRAFMFMNVVNAKEKRREYKRKWITANSAAVKKSKDSEVVGISQSSSSDECNQSEDVLKDSKVSTVSDMDASSNIGDVCMDQFTENEFEDDQDDWTWDMIDSHMIHSTDESAEDSDTNKNFKTTLAKWMTKHNITQNASDDLLKLLRESGHPNLQKTARSLLRTPRNTQTEDKSGMEYKYLGLIPALKGVLQGQMGKNTEISELKLSLNIDVLPIFKSTKDSLWPILCQVMNVQPPVVFPIALTYGKSKPADLTFLDDTIADLQNIIQNGLLVDEKTYKVSLECIVCDAPAKVMIKNIKLHCGYYGCDKCSQKGVYIGKITYQQVDNLELKTDSTFRQKENPEHHHGETPFSDLPIDMANAFPIDYMHQRFIPKLFARQPRSLDEVDRWKATEYRQFLLYTGKIVLKHILPKAFYDHFLVLSVALSILVSSKLTAEHHEYAHQLLVYFVSKSMELYGKDFLVYNVHCLLHLTKDAARFGCLDSCSAFPFENYMQQLKKMIRSTKKPIVQIERRLTERQQAHTAHHVSSSAKMSFKKPNNAYVLNDTSCCEVTAPFNQDSENAEKMYLCRVYEQAQPLFMEPCDSNLIGALTVRRRNSCMKVLPISDLSTKAIQIESSNRKSIFLAILREV